MGMEPMLTISDVSRRSGVASSALRFYEERGLIRSERAGSGHRRYPRSALRRIAFIVFAQRIGLSLDEIAAELAKLPSDRIPTRRDWSRLSGQWTRRIDQRIAELERLRLPVLRPLRARQSGGYCRSARARPALLAGLALPLAKVVPAGTSLSDQWVTSRLRRVGAGDSLLFAALASMAPGSAFHGKK